MRIFLIGFMGSGKTYTGRRLARLAGLPFIDLDEWIEEKEKDSVRGIFEKKGEPYFRNVEREALRAMAQFRNAVISCGGGAPCFFDNMPWMNENGITIYLRAPAEVLARRLARRQERRPLLKGFAGGELLGFIRSKLAEREPFYLDSSIVYEQVSEEEDVAEALFLHFKNLVGH